DQAIAFGSEQLSSEAVNAMLGTVDRNHVLALLVALAEGEPGGVLKALAGVSEHCPDELALLDELISQLHQLAVCQAVPGSADDTLTQLAAALTAEQVQLYYDVALRGRRDIQDAPDSRAALEMILLRMVLFSPRGVLHGGEAPSPAKKPEAGTPPAAPGGRPDLRALLNTPPPAASDTPPQAAPAATEDDSPPWAETPTAPASKPAAADPVPSAAAALQAVEQGQPTARVQPEAKPEPTPEPEPQPRQAAPEPRPPLPEPRHEGEVSAWWAALLERLPVDGTVRNLARNAVLLSRQDNTWTLRLSSGHDVLVNRQRLDELAVALSEYFQRRIQLQVQYQAEAGDTPEALAEARRQQQLAEARETLRNDAVIQQLINTFDARLDEESVKPRVGDDHGL
ncbi:MAG: DNA polymerase III subunit gamma/tau C-terminal domain-containing protein, partial [Alcanivorax sp.]|nr:DNA polymerase III subunit gamma/tau C-terminal domain-containing protein [Alcanivorax sp.]